MAIYDTGRRPTKVGDRPVGDLEIGGMAQPHSDVLRQPSRLVAVVDGDRQAAVDRVADLLVAVDDDVDLPPSPRDQRNG